MMEKVLVPKKLIMVIKSKKLNTLNYEPKVETGFEAEIETEGGKKDIDSRMGAKDIKRPTLRRKRLVLVIKHDKLKKPFPPRAESEHDVEVEEVAINDGMEVKDIDPGRQEDSGEHIKGLQMSQTSNRTSTINDDKPTFSDDTEATHPTSSHLSAANLHSDDDDDDSDAPSSMNKGNKFMLRFKLDESAIKSFNDKSDIDLSNFADANSGDKNINNKITTEHPSPTSSTNDAQISALQSNPQTQPKSVAEIQPRSLSLATPSLSPASAQAPDVRFCILCKGIHSSPCPPNSISELLSLNRTLGVYPIDADSNEDHNIQPSYPQPPTHLTPTHLPPYIQDQTSAPPSEALPNFTSTAQPSIPPAEIKKQAPDDERDTRAAAMTSNGARPKKCITCGGIHAGNCYSNYDRLNEIDEDLGMIHTLTQSIETTAFAIAASLTETAGSSPSKARMLQDVKHLETAKALLAKVEFSIANSRALMLERAMREGNMEAVAEVRESMKRAREKGDEPVVKREDAEKWFKEMRGGVADPTL